MEQNSHQSPLSEKIITQAIGFELTPAIKQHVAEQLDRLFRHEPDIEKIELFLEINELKNSTSIYEVTARIAVPGPDITFDLKDENLYAGITQLSHKLDRQLRRRSRKQNSHKTRRVKLDELDV